MFCSGCVNILSRSKQDEELVNNDFIGCGYVLDNIRLGLYWNRISPISTPAENKIKSDEVLNYCIKRKEFYYDLSSSVKVMNHDDMLSMDQLRLAMKKEQFKRACRIASRLINIYPDDYEIYRIRGNAYLRLDMYDEAIVDFDKAISLGTKKTDVYVNKAQALIETGKIDLAIKYIDNSLSKKPAASLYNIRAYAWNKKGDFDKSLQDSDKSIEMDNSTPNAYKNKGLAYYGKMEYTNALDQFDKSISVDPIYTLALDGRGDTYLKLGNKEKAMADFRKSCEQGYQKSCYKIKQY